jgi:hypothetical protein
MSIPQNPRAPQARRLDSYQTLIFRVALLAALLAVAPRVLASPAACEQHAVRSHQALRAESLENWEPLDDRTVLIWTRHSERASLVRLARPLEGLTAARIIILVAGDGDRTISACGHDALTLGHDQSERARIVSIKRLSRRLTAALDAGEAAPNVTLSRT